MTPSNLLLREKYTTTSLTLSQVTTRIVDKSYETVSSSLTQGDIPLDKVTGYFAATLPHQIMKLIADVEMNASPTEVSGSESSQAPVVRLYFLGIDVAAIPYSVS